MDPYDNSQKAQDDKYNPAMNRRSSLDLKDAENQSSNFNNDTGTADNSAKSLSSQELASGFKNSFTGKSGGGGWGKKGGIFGAVVGVIITGGIVFTTTQIGQSLASISDPIDDKNNVLADAFERRAPYSLARMLGANSKDFCKTAPTGLRCKTSKVSNKALKPLYKNGIVANFPDGTSYTGKPSRGYPKEPPKSYTFTDSRGGQSKTVAAKDIKSFLEHPDNTRFTAKIVGRRGAFQVRSRVWRGKAINKMFSHFGVDLKGGKGKAVQGDGKTVYEKTRDNHHKNIPKVDNLNDEVKNRTSTKLKSLNKKLGKGSLAYVVAAGGCVIVKIPSIVAAGVTAVQLARIVPQYTDLVLSPASQQKVSGVDQQNSIKQGEVAALMTMLTHKTKNSEGRMTNALDSPILLSAMGINHGRPPVNGDVVPGYSIINSKFITGGQAIDSTIQPYCNIMLNPITMYSFATAETSAALVAAGLSGGLAGVAYAGLKIVGQVTLSVVVGEVGKIVASGLMDEVIKKIAQNDIIGTAEGEELGDILGIAAMSFYSSGALTRNLSVLTEAQTSDQVAVKNYLNNQEKLYDLATLSPFDTSSKYTFMGSMAYSLRNFALTNRLHTQGSIYSSLATLTSLPSYILSPASAQAANNNYSNYCSYAKEFGMDSGDPKTTPAINASGMPCTGMTLRQSTMSFDTAIDSLERMGWISTGAEYEDGASVEELIGNVIVKKDDNPMIDFIESCSHPESGDFIYNASGCMFPGSSVDSGKGVKVDIPEGFDADSVNQDFNDDIDPESLQAISVFLIDYQLSNVINGEDDGDGTTASAGSQDGTSSGDTAGDDSAGPKVDGSSQKLAQQLLASPNVRFWDQSRDAGDKSRPSDNLRSIAKGEPARTSTRGHAGGKTVAVDPNILKFLVDLSKNNKITINALVGQVHSATSNHYKGRAVDLDCSPTANLYRIADPIASKYGVGKNWENCTPEGNNHWHYEVGH